MCLYECLERFNLFGFTATRDRLRAMVGVAGSTWTSAQLVAAMDALAEARRSWVAYLSEAERARGAEKPGGARSTRPVQWSWHNEWLEGYLVGDVADRWLVSGLGECSVCQHALIHHGRSFCTACSASPEIGWEDRCQGALPSPG